MVMYYGDLAPTALPERRKKQFPTDAMAAPPGMAPSRPIRGGSGTPTDPNPQGPVSTGPISWTPPGGGTGSPGYDPGPARPQPGLPSWSPGPPTYSPPPPAPGGGTGGGVPDPPKNPPTTPPSDGGPVAQPKPNPNPGPPTSGPMPGPYPGPNPPIWTTPTPAAPVSYNPPAGSTNPTRPNDATAKGASTPAATKATPGGEMQTMTQTAPPAAVPNVINQDPGTAPPGWPQPPGSPGGTTGSGGGVVAGPGSMGGPGGTSGTSSTWGLGGDYSSPTGGLVSYYNQKMGSNGFSPEERVALAATTVNPIQQEAQQARDQMLRIRAATGNDAGLYGAVAENAKNAMGAVSNQQRQNLLSDKQVQRAEQAEGAAGNLNLYGQDQAETMEYIRMLGNLLGRQDSVSSYGSSKGSDVGIQYTPGM